MAFKRLSDGNIKLTSVVSKPTAPDAANLADLTGAAVVDLTCGINKSDYKLGATGNSSVTEQEACKKGEGNAPGPASYEGSVTPFIYFGENDQPDTAENTAWDALKTPGTTLYLFEREGKAATAAWAAGDQYEYYEVITGDPQPPSSRMDGYVKRIVPLFVQDHQSGTVAAS